MTARGGKSLIPLHVFSFNNQYEDELEPSTQVAAMLLGRGALWNFDDLAHIESFGQACGGTQQWQSQHMQGLKMAHLLDRFNNFPIIQPNDFGDDLVLSTTSMGTAGTNYGTICRCRIEFFTLLIRMGCDLHHANYDGITAAHTVLVSFEQRFLRSVLMRKGPEYLRDQHGQYPLPPTCQAQQNVVPFSQNLQITRHFASDNEIKVLCHLDPVTNHSLLCYAASQGFTKD